MAMLMKFKKYCNILFVQSYKLNEAMYFSEWLDASHSFKRSMMMFMCRTEQPPQINVAGFVPLSLTMFRRVSVYFLIHGGLCY
jgi:hypothetical protein